MTGEAALRSWESDQKHVSFPVNIPYITTLVATRKSSNRKFVVNAISTDGGSSPRNMIVNSGLALVRYGALSLNEFVVKTSFNPSRMWGMLDKGSLGIGVDADVTVLDIERGKAVMGIALGKVIMVDNVITGTGGTIITTEKGVRTVQATGLPYDVVDLNECGLYTQAPFW